MMGQESRISSLGDWSVSGVQRSKTAGKHRVNLYLFIWICKIPWGKENRYDMNALMKWNMRPDLWINIRNKNILKCILVLGHLLCLAANSRFAQSHTLTGVSAWHLLEMLTAQRRVCVPLLPLFWLNHDRLINIVCVNYIEEDSLPYESRSSNYVTRNHVLELRPPKLSRKQAATASWRHLVTLVLWL